ncbi:hypothetical protein ACVWYG_000696 [Pedobacter sp. UYEF25]
MQNDFLTSMSKRTDKELLEIITKNRGDYQTEAIIAAEQIIINRHLWTDDLTNLITEKKNVVVESVIVDPVGIWKSARLGIITFCIAHFLFEIIIGNNIGAALPVFVNYMVSGWYIKGQISKHNNLMSPYFKGLIVSLIVFIIRLLLGLLFSILFLKSI